MDQVGNDELERHGGRAQSGDVFWRNHAVASKWTMD